MKKFKPMIFCLVETKTNDDRLERFCSKLKSKWNWAAIVAEGYSGGIITIWSHSIGYVTPLVKSKHVFHLVITTSTAKTWIISTVYNSNHLQGQCILWRELSGLNYLNLPWIILGDFNVVIS